MRLEVKIRRSSRCLGSQLLRGYCLILRGYVPTTRLELSSARRSTRTFEQLTPAQQAIHCRNPVTATESGNHPAGIA
jgi:hypothetical protein